jgi:hypothetical protein
VCAFRRAAASAAIALLFLLSHAGVASAKQDWLGWLEEFSGPGPFDGFEVSAEVLCYNISDVSVVTPQSLMNVKVAAATSALMQLKNSTTNPVVIDEIDRAAKRLLAFSTIRQPSLIPGVVMPSPPPATQQERANADAEMQQRFETIARGLSAADQTAQGLLTRVKNAWNPTGMTALVSDNRSNPNALGLMEENRRFISSLGSSKRKPWRTCINAQADLERERASERARSFGALVEMANGGLPSEEVVTSRSDHQIGIVINAGKYVSLENRFYDPDGSRTDEPQLRVIPLEILAHSKLSPSIDVGAGIGMALFHLDGQAHSHAQVYFVPLSVIVRPAKFFTDSRFGSMVGYRLAVRRFRSLDGADFGGAVTDFKQRGEFLWSSALFVDVTGIFAKRRVQ